MLLQCLAALLLLGDPLGLEGCQHSVQPQPLQALWARREAKCSERALQLPAQEDSGKPPGRGQRKPPGFYFIFKLYITVLVLPNINMNPPQVYMFSQS